MRVQVLYFGVLKECFGAERDAAELAEGSSVEDLLHLLRERAEGAVVAWSSMAVAVNREYAGRATVLQDGDEVALLPPVSGGAGASQVLEARLGAAVAVKEQEVWVAG